MLRCDRTLARRVEALPQETSAAVPPQRQQQQQQHRQMTTLLTETLILTIPETVLVFRHIYIYSEPACFHRAVLG